MTLNNICIICGGLLTFLMSIFHCFFYRIFEWGKDFKNISNKNKKVYFTIHIALIGYFIIFSFISLFFYKDLNNKTPLSLSILILISFFWFLRSVWQIVYFKKPENVKIKMPNRYLHYILTVYFFITSILYFIPVLR